MQNALFGKAYAVVAVGRERHVGQRHFFKIALHVAHTGFDELLTEIESIVESGTKINIDYFLTQIMDEDRTNDIFDYFREESESDDINDAVEGLGGDYTEEEIRLVRIKFLSEMGN